MESLKLLFEGFVKAGVASLIGSGFIVGITFFLKGMCLEANEGECHEKNCHVRWFDSGGPDNFR